MSDAPKTAPELIAEAVATRLCVVLPLPKTEEGSEFDQAMRATFAKIEQTGMEQILRDQLKRPRLSGRFPDETGI